MRILFSREKILTTLGLILWLSVDAQFLTWARRNNPEYDRRKITYGFSIGLHNSAYQIRYSEEFVKSLDELHSVMPRFNKGFSLGFLVNRRFNENFDLRLMPKAGFYDHELVFNYTDRTSKSIQIETTMVEFPTLLKYKSARRGNVRMYVVGGFTPGIEASGKEFVTDDSDKIQIKKTNVSLEGGMGFDLYFPLFKFSPEIRYSRGLRNILRPVEDPTDVNIFRKSLNNISTNTISIYLIFQ